MPWVTSAVFERMPAKEKIQVGEVNSWRMEPTIERISAVTLRVANMMKSVRSFRWRDYAHSGKKKVMTVSAHEFLRRFLLHVLPGGLVRIRHFGLFANRRRRAALERCRSLLGVVTCAEPPEPPSLRCPACSGIMLVVERLTRGQLYFRPGPTLAEPGRCSVDSS